MKSIKPGRGSSLEHGIGGLIAVVFGIVWLKGAASMGAPSTMLVFGGLLVLVGILNAFLGFYNANAKNRLSEYDIVEDEPDIFEQKLGNTQKEDTIDVVEKDANDIQKTAYCPYCGAKADENYAFCRACGKKL